MGDYALLNLRYQRLFMPHLVADDFFNARDPVFHLLVAVFRLVLAIAHHLHRERDAEDPGNEPVEVNFQVIGPDVPPRDLPEEVVMAQFVGGDFFKNFSVLPAEPFCERAVQDVLGNFVFLVRQYPAQRLLCHCRSPVKEVNALSGL